MTHLRNANAAELCVYDMATGGVDVVLRTATLIEAPNWSGDGASLIVNAEGRLYRVPLSNPSLKRIDTGFAQAINNDHGVSPDGSQLVITDKTEFGQACMYTLPCEGGTPQRISELTPSYWHGWSPDGKILSYVALRQDRFRIAVCPAIGGPETIISGEFDHCDGPDFTPDGQWIWFNGERNESVQLWRTSPEGCSAERMTDDERVNWFPHPSPDGQHVVYLSYAPGTRQHPPERHVQLRRIDPTGGKPEVLVELYGGQGTLNVPCWHPDSSAFAFVRYAVVQRPPRHNPVVFPV